MNTVHLYTWSPDASLTNINSNLVEAVNQISSFVKDYITFASSAPFPRDPMSSVTSPLSVRQQI